MAWVLSPAEAPGSDAGLALRALLFAAAELPIETCRQLAQGLVAHIAVVTQDFEGDIVRRRPEPDQRAIDALRGVASKLGHVPSTTEYTAEFERRRDRGEEPIPSASAIVKRFGSWRSALSQAGLVVPELSRVQVRRYVGKKRVHRYPDERITECLRACAHDLGYPPSVRDYAVWREEKLGGNPGRRRPGADIPHYRTVQDRFGGWSKALHAAGLDPALKARRRGFSPV